MLLIILLIYSTIPYVLPIYTCILGDLISSFRHAVPVLERPLQGQGERSRQIYMCIDVYAVYIRGIYVWLYSYFVYSYTMPVLHLSSHITHLR